MRGIKLLLTGLLALSALLFIFASCGECEHVWEEKGYVAKEPTDKAVGYRFFTCTLCGTKKSEEIPMLSHMNHEYTKLQWDSDNTHHWLCCEFKDCTATTGKGVHTYADAPSGGYICHICRGESSEHSFGTDMKYDNDLHWAVCQDEGCPVTAYKLPHTVADGKCTGCDFTSSDTE